MSSYIFVDLDGTLFNTPQLGIDTANLLQSELAISPDDYELARQEMFKINNKIYSAELHARLLARKVRFDEADLVLKFINLFEKEDSVRYVYQDSLDFLDSMNIANYVTILTYGEAYVQTPRASKSGLRTHVKDVIVTQKNKADTIFEYIGEVKSGSGSNIVLIDDSLEHLEHVKARFKDSTTLHLRRNGQIEPDSQHIQVQSLTEAKEYLNTKLSLVRK